MVNKFRASLLALFWLSIASSSSAQMPAPPRGKPIAPGLIKLTGDDEKRAEQLDEQIDKAIVSDRWSEAVAKAEELLTLRKRAQGPTHFDTVTEEWRAKALRRVAEMPEDDRAAYQSAQIKNRQVEALYAQGKYSAAQ